MESNRVNIEGLTICPKVKELSKPLAMSLLKDAFEIGEKSNRILHAYVHFCSNVLENSGDTYRAVDDLGLSDRYTVKELFRLFFAAAVNHYGITESEMLQLQESVSRSERPQA